MYAVVRTGGKQYRVAPGDILEVEKLAGDVGDSVVLDDVLLVAGGDGVRIGRPNVDGASVTARITGQHRGEKILVFRYRPKKRVRVRRGHRQYVTRLQIDKISGEDFEFPEETHEEAAPEPVAEEAEAAVEAGAAGAPVAVVAETDSVTEADETNGAGAEEETVAKAGDALDAVGDIAGDVVEAASDTGEDTEADDAGENKVKEE